MPTFAFWNVDGKAPAAKVAALAHEWDTDILVLAENTIAIPALLQELNKGAERLYFRDIGQSDRLTILTRFQSERSSLIRDSFGVSIRHYKMPIGASFLLVAVHLSSKLWKKTEDQILATTRLAGFIRDAEQAVGHSRTIVIGDLNMNPFEAGVVGAGGLHGVMDRSIASGVSRIVQGEPYTFFYNPMWAILGSQGSLPPGSYFYNSGAEVNYFWNVFDQVLVRPTLLDSLSTESVTVVTEIQGATLLTDRGRPNRDEFSDHLPLVCRLTHIEEPINGS